jgi:hypothetical protein
MCAPGWGRARVRARKTLLSAPHLTLPQPTRVRASAGGGNDSVDSETALVRRFRDARLPGDE